MGNELTTIDFYDDEILAYEDEETGQVNVNVRRICEALGVSRQGQLKKLKADPTFSKGLSQQLMLPPLETQKSWFIDAELLQGWMFSIQVARVKPELRDKLNKYKLEAAKALHSHFTKGFSINEQAMEQAPNIVIKGLVGKIDELSAKFDNYSQTPTVLAEELVERRMSAMGKVFDLLGKPDKAIVSTLRNQMLTQLSGGDPAPTLADQGIYYASDYWRKVKSGKRLTNVGYKSDQILVSVIGRYGASYSRRHSLAIRPTNTVIPNGRIGNSNMLHEEALSYAVERLINEGKITQQMDTGYL